jgi:hypothetical protein
MRSLLAWPLRIFSSLGLSCVLLCLLALLTYLGTLEQVDHGLYDVQKKYFESFFLVHRWTVPLPFVPDPTVSVPLPGANLVLCLLGINIVIGGMVRLRKSWSTAGVLVTHVGIALLLVSGLVKMYASQDGHVTLFEGDSSDHFQSYYRWELVVHEDLLDGRVKDYIVPQEDFAEAAEGRVTLTSPELPFDVELAHLMHNCDTWPKGPMFDVDVPVVDGIFLKELPKEKEAERNVAGVYATVVAEGTRQENILYGLERAPWTILIGDRRFALELRHERYPMPFSVRLDDFTKVDHPRIDMPAHFSSDVTVTESGTPRSVHIKMNEPLRDEGLVIYQASWGPSNAGPNARLFSTLAVVRNPADQYPLYACIVIATGMILHFGRKLTRYIRVEAKHP